MVASALAVEMMVNLLHHPLGSAAEADLGGGVESGGGGGAGAGARQQQQQQQLGAPQFHLKLCDLGMAKFARRRYARDESRRQRVPPHPRRVSLGAFAAGSYRPNERAGSTGDARAARARADDARAHVENAAGGRRPRQPPRSSPTRRF